MYIKLLRLRVCLLIVICIPIKSFCKLFTDYPIPAALLKNVERCPEKRKTSYPFISGDSFRAYCDFIIDETQIPIETNSVVDGDSVFVNASFLDYFFSKIHPFITKKYILVTHNSIKTVPGKFEKHLNDTTLVAWFGKNTVSDNPKMHPIPLGLANSWWPHGNIDIIKQIASLPRQEKKDHLLYLNIAKNTNSIRPEIIKMFENQCYCFKAAKKPFADYLKDLVASCFVLSPQGAGIDCHRTWEAMLLGCIPVVTHSGIDKLFEDLPVLCINDWTEINEEYLYEQIKIIQSKKIMYEKLYMDYWLNQIKTEQDKVR